MSVSESRNDLGTERSRDLRVALFQPALPHYRLSVFQMLSRQKELDITIFYSEVQNLPNVDPVGLKANRLNVSKLNIFGEPVFFVWRMLLATLFGNYNGFVFTWDPHYLFLVPALLLAKLRGKGTVLWGHGYSKTEISWKRWVRLFIGKLADVVVLYNSKAVEDLVRVGFDSERVFVAPNTQDQSEIQQAREYWLSTPDRLKEFQRQKGVSPQNTILFCSRLEAANRVDWLIEAHSRLIKNNANVKLIIIGRGPEEENLKRRVLDLDIKSSVLFQGSIYDQNQLAPWFLSAGVFCYPRNIGLSILHSFGYGLPVVTSDDLSAQNPEVEALRNEKNGFYYQDGNIEDLVLKLKLLLNNAKLRKNTGVEARRTALEDYPMEKMVLGLKESFFAATDRHGLVNK